MSFSVEKTESHITEYELDLTEFVATQSSTEYQGYAYHANDGLKLSNYHDESCTFTGTVMNPWWTLDMQKRRTITSVHILNRSDGK